MSLGHGDPGFVTRDRTGLTLADGAGLVAGLAVFWWLGGTLGIVLGVVWCLSALVTDGPLVAAAGYLCLAAVLPAGTPAVTILVAGTPVLVVLASRLIAYRWSRRRAAIAVGTAVAVLATGTILVGRSDPLWIGALALVGLVAGASYGLHRYSVVVFRMGDADRGEQDNG